MWRDYLSGYIKNNRASTVSVVLAAFLSSLLLSLLCGLSYNLWVYEIARIEAEEGVWEGRLTGEITEEEIGLLRNYANVESAVINAELSGESGTVADFTFKNSRSIFADMPQIARLAGLPAEAVTYHYALLNLYLIRDADDPALRWVFPFACIIAAAACLSLVLVIHNAFAVTMNTRIRQFGIFSSIGATPRQIRACLLQEAAVLCAAPVAVGGLSGILLCMGIVEGMNFLLADVGGRLVLPFSYHPLVLSASLLLAALTIWISAWIPAKKLSKLTPLEAMKNTGDFSLKRKRDSRMLSLLFGVEGELAANALRAQRKAMRTAAVSLTLSFLAFSFLMCFFAVVTVSQRETYFERYQDAWDVMATVKNTQIDAFAGTDAVREISGVKSTVVYQKVKAKRFVAPEALSAEMKKAGGLADAPAEYVSAADGGWLVNAPLVIMDDASFLEYCAQIGATPRLSGAVILNRTYDAADPNFRARRAFPYLTGEGSTTTLVRAGQAEVTAELPVLGYTQEVPVLREEYGTLDFYELVHFLPVSCWKEIKEQIGGAEEDCRIRILTEEKTPETLDEIENALARLLGGTYETEIENRMQERLDNDRMMGGMKAILTVFCILLAAIGIGNVFSNTFGFVRQRKREFARYLSVGLTPDGMKKIFLIEALVIAGRPVLFALPATAAAVAAFIKISYLSPALFLGDIPFPQILFFLLAIFGFVGLAYYLGAGKVLKSNPIDALRDDTIL